MWIFRPKKLHQKSMWKERGFFDQQNSNEKKYVETTWKFVGIWFWTYRRRFSLKLIQPGFDVVCPLGIWSVDLANMQLISKSNKETRFLLCVIDIFSNDA